MPPVRAAVPESVRRLKMHRCDHDPDFRLVRAMCELRLLAEYTSASKAIAPEPSASKTDK